METLAWYWPNIFVIKVLRQGEKVIFCANFSDQDHNWCNFQKIASMTFLEIENLDKIVSDDFPLYMDISESNDKFSDLLLIWISLIKIIPDATLHKDCFGDVLRERDIQTISMSDD